MSEGNKAWPEKEDITTPTTQPKQSASSLRAHCKWMDSPKHSGNLVHCGSNEVGIKVCKLPGASNLLSPSAKMTNINAKDETIPMRDVMERNRIGTKVVGTMMKNPRNLNVCAEIAGKSAAAESPNKTMRAILSDLHRVNGQ